jgi:ketosteroid isomerase-like protein
MRKLFNCVAAVALLVPTPLIAAPVVDAAGLEAAIDQSHRALHAILNGDPKLYEALFADRDDVTLGNPFGPYAKGKAAVAKTLAGAAAKYRDGQVIAVDRVAVYADNRLAVIVEVEHDRAKVGSRTDLADFSARVTSAYEFIDGKWLLVHRHADPITSPRPTDSVLAK